MAKNPKSNDVYLISNGDFRDSANRMTWPLQEQTIKLVAGVCKKLGLNPRSCPLRRKRKHGFIRGRAKPPRVSHKRPRRTRVRRAQLFLRSTHGRPLGTHKGPSFCSPNFDGTNPASGQCSTTPLARPLLHPPLRLWTESFLAIRPS